MKNCTLITALLMGISLSLSAQKTVLPSLIFFASFTTGKPVTNMKPAPVLLAEANWAYFNNKTCKVFTELGNLGEDFWVEETPFTVLSGYTLANIIGKGSKYRTTAYATQLADFQRLFGQEPRFAGK